MKYFQLLIISLVLLLSACDMLDGDPINLELMDNYFEFTGELTTGNEVSPEMISLIDYPDSFIKIFPKADDPKTTIFQIRIYHTDYNKNYDVSPDAEWAGLPGGLPIPGVYYGGKEVSNGGSGVGNGFLPTQESFSSLGPIRVYQKESTFGFFIATPMTLNEETVISTRVIEKHKRGVLTLMGYKPEMGTSGFVLLFNNFLNKQ